MFKSYLIIFFAFICFHGYAVSQEAESKHGFLVPPESQEAGDLSKIRDGQSRRHIELVRQMQPQTFQHRSSAGGTSLYLKGEQLGVVSMEVLRAEPELAIKDLLVDMAPLTQASQQLDVRLDGIIDLSHGVKSYRFKQYLNGVPTTDIGEVSVTSSGVVQRINAVLVDYDEVSDFVIQQEEAIFRAKEALRIHHEAPEIIVSESGAGQSHLKKYYGITEDLYATPFWEITLSVVQPNIGVRSVRVDAVSGETEILNKIEDAGAY